MVKGRGVIPPQKGGVKLKGGVSPQKNEGIEWGKHDIEYSPTRHYPKQKNGELYNITSQKKIDPLYD